MHDFVAELGKSVLVVGGVLCGACLAGGVQMICTPEARRSWRLAAFSFIGAGLAFMVSMSMAGLVLSTFARVDIAVVQAQRVVTALLQPSIQRQEETARVASQKLVELKDKNPSEASKLLAELDNTRGEYYSKMETAFIELRGAPYRAGATDHAQRLFVEPFKVGLLLMVAGVVLSFLSRSMGTGIGAVLLVMLTLSYWLALHSSYYEFCIQLNKNIDSAPAVVRDVMSGKK